MPFCDGSQSTRYNQLIYVFFSLFRKMQDYYDTSIRSQLFPSKFYTLKNIICPFHDTRVHGINTEAEGELHLFLSAAIDESN